MYSSRVIGSALTLLLPLATGCLQSPRQASPPQEQFQQEGASQAVSNLKTTAAEATPAPLSKFPCGNTQTIQFGPKVPPDMSRVSSQADADCFAWAQFISLNWPASASQAGGGTPDASFGTPGDLTAVQWQTYMDRDLLFQPDGGKPPDWGTQPQPTPGCLSEAKVSEEEAAGMLTLMVTSKFAEQFGPRSSEQAFPHGAPAWLGARNGTNVWYNVRVSKAEYDYIVNAGLYNRNTQAAWVDGGTGRPIQLPPGSFSTDIGTIELKSAWMEVTDPGDTRWNRYKLAPAVVVDPATQRCRKTTVALVGLHIIHKTQGQPTFVWATFEHVDNAPDHGVDPGTTDWNFYNPKCQPRTVKLSPNCAADKKSTHVTVGCEPNVAPPYYLGDGCPAPLPIQVTRLTPIDATAQSINRLVQQQIAQNFPGSVWQNYFLVNTLWSTSPSRDPSVPVKVPLPFSGAIPSMSIPIANTTLETYIQVSDPKDPSRVSNCIMCHQNATIADGTWASDFSFVFETAGPQPSPRILRAKSKEARVAEPPEMRRIIR